MPDFLTHNGTSFQASGGIASTLLANDMDPMALRPYWRDGRKWIDRRVGNKVVAVPAPTANATLRYEDWKTIDSMATKIYKERLRVISDFRSRGLEYSITDGLAKTVLLTEAQSDMNPAEVSMDGKAQSQFDRPTWSLTNLPLPIIHKDFGFNARQIAASRTGSSPLDLAGLETATRLVVEEAEKMFLGVSTVADQFKAGGGTIYGLTDHPNRNTKTITNPTSSGYAATTTVTEVLAMRTQAYGDKFYGPFGIYCAPNWDTYMDDDYSTSKGDLTLRQRLAMIEGIEFVNTSYHLSNYDLILVGLRSDVARVVVGLDLTTVQWEVEGGMELRYKVMAILVPQVRVDKDSNSGIVHGTV